MRTNASRSSQRQPEVVEPHEDPKANPTKGGKATSRSWTEEEHRPDLRYVTEHEDEEHHRTQESRGTAVPRGQANKYLTKNQGNNLHSRATEGGPPRINLNHLKPAANTGSEREEPKVRPKKTAGARTTQRPESPSETQATTGEGAARGQGVRTAQPSIRRVQNPGVAGGATNL